MNACVHCFVYFIFICWNILYIWIWRIIMNIVFLAKITQIKWKTKIILLPSYFRFFFFLWFCICLYVTFFLFFFLVGRFGISFCVCYREKKKKNNNNLRTLCMLLSISYATTPLFFSLFFLSFDCMVFFSLRVSITYVDKSAKWTANIQSNMIRE